MSILVGRTYYSTANSGITVNIHIIRGGTVFYRWVYQLTPALNSKALITYKLEVQGGFMVEMRRNP